MYGNCSSVLQITTGDQVSSSEHTHQKHVSLVCQVQTCLRVTELGLQQRRRRGFIPSGSRSPPDREGDLWAKLKELRECHPGEARRAEGTTGANSLKLEWVWPAGGGQQAHVCLRTQGGGTGREAPKPRSDHTGLSLCWGPACKGSC